MQIILLHFEFVLLSSHKKVDNQSDIKRCTNVDSYEAKAKQRKGIFSQISETNYQVMLTNISRLPTNDTVQNSTNFLVFLNHFSSPDTDWLDTINNAISI